MKRFLALSVLFFSALFFESGYCVTHSSTKIDLPQWKTVEGLPTIMVESHDTPLTSIMIGFPFGAYNDPKGKEGLTQFFSSMLLRGTKTRNRHEIEDELDRLGAVLRVDSGYHSSTIRGEVLNQHFEPFFNLLKDILQNTTFPEDEIQKLQKETLAALKLRFEDDKRLAKLHFQKEVYNGHPYGDDGIGDEESLKKISRQDLLDFYRAHIHRGGMVLGAAGEVNETFLKNVSKTLHDIIPEGDSSPKVIPFDSKIEPGRHVILVDKPNRTQTQFYIGHPAISVSNPDRTALTVFLTAFGGGLFQAKYMQEIRVKRGWSYGAVAGLDIRRDGGTFSMYTFPATKDTIPALALSLDLLDQALTGDLLKDSDIDFAKQYLTGSFPFKIDTPKSVVMSKIHNHYVGLPDDHIETYLERVSAVTPKMAREAAQKHLNTKNVDIVVVCTAKDLQADIKEKLNAKDVKIVPFDQL